MPRLDGTFVTFPIPLRQPQIVWSMRLILFIAVSLFASTTIANSDTTYCDCGSVFVQTLFHDTVLNGGTALMSDGSIVVSGSGQDGVLNGSFLYRVQPGSPIIDTFAIGMPPFPVGIEFNAAGHLFTTGWNSGVVSRIDHNLNFSFVASGIPGPAGLRLTPDGGILVASFYDHAIYRVDTLGNNEQLITMPNGSSPATVAVDNSNGDIYVGRWFDGTISKYAADGSLLMEEYAHVPVPPATGVGGLVKRGNYLFALGYAANRLFRIDALTGKVCVLAGSGVPGVKDGPAEHAWLFNPGGMSVNATGDTIYFTQDHAGTSGAGPGYLRRVVINEPPLSSASIQRSVDPIDLVVYPNPVRTNGTIRWKATPGQQRLQLLAADGRVVQRWPLSPEQSALSWRVANLPAGSYVVQLIHGAGVVTRKVQLLGR